MGGLDGPITMTIDDEAASKVEDALLALRANVGVGYFLQVCHVCNADDAPRHLAPSKAQCVAPIRGEDVLLQLRERLPSASGRSAEHLGARGAGGSVFHRLRPQLREDAHEMLPSALDAAEEPFPLTLPRLTAPALVPIRGDVGYEEVAQEGAYVESNRPVERELVVHAECVLVRHHQRTRVQIAVDERLLVRNELVLHFGCSSLQLLVLVQFSRPVVQLWGGVLVQRRREVGIREDNLRPKLKKA